MANQRGALRQHRRLAMLIVAGLVAGCTSGAESGGELSPGTDPSATVTTEPDTTEPDTTEPANLGPAPTIPAPPAPLAPTGDLASTITTLADAFEHRDAQRLPALLAAYRLAGIPVVDSRDAAADAPGTTGIPFTIVHAAALVPNETSRVSLTDVARVLQIDGADVAALAEQLSTGLREALTDPAATSGAGPIAMLVAEEARRYNGASLADPATTADSVFVSVPTASVIVSAGLLTTVVAARDATQPEGTASSSPSPSGLRSPGAAPQLLAPPESCTFDDAFSQWAVWIISKINGGIEIPDGPSWKGLFGELLDSVLSKGAAELAAAVTTWVSTALTVLTTVVAAMTFSADVRLKGGEPLVRTKQRLSRGAVDAILVTVKYDFGTLGADTAAALNCILFVLAAIGNNATLPEPGPVGAGVAVTIQGLPPAFGERLNTAGSYVELDQLTAETDDTGTAEFTVAGKSQRKDIPATAEPYDRTFTVSVSAKPDPTDINTIVKTFLDSVLCVPGTAINLSACADPFVDIARQFNWDLGAWTFQLTDWQAGWAIHDALHPEQSAAGEMFYDGVSCESLNGPWHITVGFNTAGNTLQDVSFDVVLNSDGSGTVNGREYSTWDDGLTVNGTSSGTARIVKVGLDPGEHELTLDYQEHVTLTYTGRPWLDVTQDIHHIKTLKIIAATKEECGFDPPPAESSG